MHHNNSPTGYTQKAGNLGAKNKEGRHSLCSTVCREWQGLAAIGAEIRDLENEARRCSKPLPLGSLVPNTLTFPLLAPSCCQVGSSLGTFALNVFSGNIIPFLDSSEHTLQLWQAAQMAPSQQALATLQKHLSQRPHLLFLLALFFFSTHHLPAFGTFVFIGNCCLPIVWNRAWNVCQAPKKPGAVDRLLQQLGLIDADGCGSSSYFGGLARESQGQGLPGLE